MPIVIDPSAGITGLVTPLAVPEGGTGNATGNVTSSQVAGALNATGSAPLYACRAWVNFNGTGTVAIRASGNVSSITDNGVGNYTVNFATAMVDVDYCLMATCSSTTSTHNNFIAGQTITDANAVGAATVSVTNGGTASRLDVERVYVSIFR